jgi:hypothetical protein
MDMVQIKANSDVALATSTDMDALVTSHSPLEEQLAEIIASARNVAIIAEELLRDVSHSGMVQGTAPHALAMAPRLLAATEQQLASVAAMLRHG